jgi:pimeloyl-ACP methyl ester carboxylesterase
MLKENERRVAGVRTRTIEGGSGPGLILLHGLGASAYSWRHLLPELAKTHSVCAPDIPGFGRSDKPAGFDYSLGGFAAWTRELLRSLGWKSAALAGNSMGGATSVRLAHDFPELVDSATLLGAPVYPTNFPKILWNLRRPFVGRLLEPLVRPWLVEFLAKSCFVDHSIITPELLEEYSIALRDPGGRRAVVAFIRNAVPVDADRIVSGYPVMKTRFLAIRGEHDAVVDRASVEKFCRTAPNARFVHIERCGHAPQEEKPAEVLAAMRAFL